MKLKRIKKNTYSKYRAKRVIINNINFASKKEGARYLELSVMRNAGLISCLVLQPVYELVVNDILICKYKPDFEYIQKFERIVEDVKGYKKGVAYNVFKMKQKLMKAIHKIDVVEI